MDMDKKTKISWSFLSWYSNPVINLNLQAIRDEDATALASVVAPFVVEINLNRNYMTGRAMQSLMKAQLINLENLSLKENRIENEGCRFLSRANWPHLKFLELTSNNISDAGIIHLSKAQWLHLHKIKLNGNQISSNGIVLLMKANWKKLKNLSIYNNPTSIDVLKQIQTAVWSLQSLNYFNNRNFFMYGETSKDIKLRLELRYKGITFDEDY